MATITGISPPAGPSAGGTRITITGSGFTGATGVAFTVQALGLDWGIAVTVVDDNTITVTSPPGSDTTFPELIAVGDSNQVPYRYCAPPVITAAVDAGAKLLVSGSGFAAAQAGLIEVTVNGVSFPDWPADGAPGTCVTENDSTMQLGWVDGHAPTNWQLSITTYGGTATWSASSPIAPPTITDITPNTGPVSGGTSVTITGTGLTGTTLSIDQNFSPLVPLDVVYVDDSHITCVMPVDPPQPPPYTEGTVFSGPWAGWNGGPDGSVIVAVTNAHGDTYGIPFTYIVPADLPLPDDIRIDTSAGWVQLATRLWAANRANHTGTQLASTISDFTAAVTAVAPPGLSAADLAAAIAGVISADNASDAAAILAAVVNLPTSTDLATAMAAAEQRVNHTGTQTASTISDFADAVREATDRGVTLFVQLTEPASSALGDIWRDEDIPDAGVTVTSITPWLQPTEPLDAKVGDLWTDVPADVPGVFVQHDEPLTAEVGAEWIDA